MTNMITLKKEGRILQECKMYNDFNGNDLFS